MFPNENILQLFTCIFPEEKLIINFKSYKNWFFLLESSTEEQAPEITGIDQCLASLVPGWHMSSQAIPFEIMIKKVEIN